jgi:hypothetical protein
MRLDHGAVDLMCEDSKRGDSVHAQLPAEAFVPDMIVVGLIAAGGLHFLGMLLRNPTVLETARGTEP